MECNGEAPTKERMNADMQPSWHMQPAARRKQLCSQLRPCAHVDVAHLQGHQVQQPLALLGRPRPRILAAAQLCRPTGNNCCSVEVSQRSAPPCAESSGESHRLYHAM